MDPVEPVPHRPHHSRIHRRLDGACAFLTEAGRCKLHEELGARRKPLACRLFPFQFHLNDGPTLVMTSFSCPTVVRNFGTPVSDQSAELSRLSKEWFEENPRSVSTLLFHGTRPMPAHGKKSLRTILEQILERPGPGGTPDLRENLLRIAAWLDDLTRRPVLGLADEALVEYLEVTGRYAATTDKSLPPPKPGRLARLLSRGFLLSILTTRLTRQAGGSSRPSMELRLKLFALLLHLHGLGPPVAGIRLSDARRVRVNLSDDDGAALIHHYLRSQIETAGTGERPLIEELAVGVATMHAALVLASLHAAQSGRSVASVDDLEVGIVEASDVLHAGEGTFSRFLGTFASGTDSFVLLATGGPFVHYA